jgi:hypothetical protein
MLQKTLRAIVRAVCERAALQPTYHLHGAPPTSHSSNTSTPGSPTESPGPDPGAESGLDIYSDQHVYIARVPELADGPDLGLGAWPDAECRKMTTMSLTCAFASIPLMSGAVE